MDVFKHLEKESIIPQLDPSWEEGEWVEIYFSKFPGLFAGGVGGRNIAYPPYSFHSNSQASTGDEQ